MSVHQNDPLVLCKPRLSSLRPPTTSTHSTHFRLVFAGRMKDSLQYLLAFLEVFS